MMMPRIERGHENRERDFAIIFPLFFHDFSKVLLPPGSSGITEAH
jgi:hypothetical protein